jgi:hypothetical protein
LVPPEEAKNDDQIVLENEKDLNGSIKKEYMFV